MQIYLKQKEIEAALKAFVSQQGISLTGKTVSVAFTAGRKDTGLSAELTIEDAATDSTNTSADAAKETKEVIKEAAEGTSEEAPVKAASLFG